MLKTSANRSTSKNMPYTETTALINPATLAIPLTPERQKKPDNEIVRLHKEFCEFCILEKNFSPNTIQCYQYSLTALLRCFQLIAISEINEGVLRQFFYHGRKEKNWSGSTILHHRKNLSPFFNWCTKNKYLADNPFKGIEKPKMESKIPEFYSEAEIEKLMYHIHEQPWPSEFLRKRNYALLATFLMTGVRRSELIGLKLTDINFEENTITIRGENSKSRRDRIIPLAQRLKDILHDYLQERRKLNKTTMSLFASFHRDMGFTKDGLKHLLDKLQVETDIHVHAHAFRHTFATKSLESNINLNTVKELLGHKDIKTTAIYLHTTVKYLKEEIEKNKINCLI
jgi:site-specific recombinase XerD